MTRGSRDRDSVRTQGSVAKQHQMTAGSLSRPAFSDSTEDRAETSAAALNLTTSNIGSINMSVDIDGITYTGRPLGLGRPVLAAGCSAASQLALPSSVRLLGMGR